MTYGAAENVTTKKTNAGLAYDAGYSAAVADVVRWLQWYHEINDFPMSSVAILKALESGSWKEQTP